MTRIYTEQTRKVSELQSVTCNVCGRVHISDWLRTHRVRIRLLSGDIIEYDVCETCLREHTQSLAVKPEFTPADPFNPREEPKWAID